MRCARHILLLLTLAAPGLTATSGCEREVERRGVPPASEWKAPGAKPSQVGQGVAKSGEEEGNPHAGMNMEGSGDPHAGMKLEGSDDPHAGMNVGGEGDPHAAPTGDQDPHANLDMGEGEVDPAMAAVNPPDPDRPIDESKFLRGTIRAKEGLAASIKPGAVLFLAARPIDPATGEVLGSPIAVARLEVEKLPMPFQLTERDAMAAGTRFDGDVLISAWVDGDGEARTKEPGDVEGMARAKVPAKGIDLVLDTPLR